MLRKALESRYDSVHWYSSAIQDIECEPEKTDSEGEWKCKHSEFRSVASTLKTSKIGSFATIAVSYCCKALS